MKPASFQLQFNFWKQEKSHGAKSGEYGGWGMTAILFFSSVQMMRCCCFWSLSGSWAKIRLRHGACPILPSEPVGMSHNQFPPPQQCCEWSDVDPDRGALEIVQQFQESCSLWVSVCSSLAADVRPVLNQACHRNTCARLKLWSPKAC